MQDKHKVVLISMSRTPIGKLGGKLRSLTASQLAAHVIESALKRARLVNASQIDVIVAGHAVQSYFEPNTARVAAQLAGIPDSSVAYTIQHQCASGMTATHAVWSAIRNAEASLGIAVGVESMSLVPLMVSGHSRYRGLNKWLTQKSPKFLRKYFKTYGPLPFFGLAETSLGPRHLAGDPATLNMIKTAQIVADIAGVTRAEADSLAARSQSNALAAIKSGRFTREIEPLVITGSGIVDTDEHPRQTDIETLSRLKDQAGTGIVTAGNASGMGDGACALVLCSEEMASALGIEPIAEIVDFAFIGRQAHSMGLGPVAAVRKLLAQNSLDISDIDYFELNEAFAAQAHACIKLLEIDQEKVNHNGSGISLSHPLGMTGARIIATAAIELEIESKGLAVATLCVGGGQGAACLIRRSTNATKYGV